MRESHRSSGDDDYVGLTNKWGIASWKPIHEPAECSLDVKSGGAPGNLCILDTQQGSP